MDGLTEADSLAIANCINVIDTATEISVIDTQKDKALDIIYLQKAKNDAFDTIDSLVGDVKDAAILTIANGYKDDISKATTPEQVTDIISRIADLETALNYYNTGKAAGQVEALSNLPTEGTTGPAVKITKGEKHITLFNPDNPENYYTTFYTSGGAYKVPEDAKAFVGEMGTVGDFDVLKLTNVGSIIHQSEAVILKAGMSDITLLPSCCQDTASTGNILEGTDTATTLRANQYALSLGKNGVGFYLWNNRPIGANKAYLDFGSVNCVPNFSFGLKFDDGTTTGIPAIITAQPDDDIIYNMQGQRVDGSYDGLVIKNGQKIYNH